MIKDFEWSSVGLSGWLISPEHAQDVSANLRVLHEKLDSYMQHIPDSEKATNGSFWPESGTHMARLRPYEVSDGVLTIPVKGVLLHQFPYAFFGIATGYEYIREAIRRGAEDEGVNAIVLEVDSPGGVVSGCFDVADEIYEARGSKPIKAVCNEFAFSAAYAIASSAESITVPRTGGVGSIGIVGMHIDVSKMLEGMGIKFNFVFAGKRKLDGVPELPLTEKAREGMQFRVDELYKIFVATVARNRGMKKSAVRETEAATFTAPESVKNGLADEIAPYIDAVAAVQAASTTTNQRGDTMSKDKAAAKQAAPTPTTGSNADTGYTDADLDKVRAEGAVSERKRITAIMDSDEASSRPTAAKQVAFKTDMSVEDAKAFLSGLPEEEGAKSTEESTLAGKSGNAFEEAMASDNPEVGAGAPKASDSKQDVAESFFGSLGMAATH